METTDIERTATNPTPTTRDVPSRTLPKPTKEQAGKGNYGYDWAKAFHFCNRSITL